MKIFAEIEQSTSILVTTTIQQTPVWKFLLWNAYEKHLPFMADEDLNYPTRIVSVAGVIIDHIFYRQVSSLSACFDNQGTWFFEGPNLWVHLPGHQPAWIATSLSKGILFGFTNQEPEVVGALQYLPDLLSVPNVEVSSDNHIYSRMRFNSGSAKINNANGVADGILAVFGNVFNVLIKRKDRMELLQQYYIAKYEINSREAAFTIKDLRERLSNSCPSAYYTREEYPDIEEKHINNIIQDAYGHVIGAKAVCINGTRIYIGNAPNTGFLTYHSFKVARKITSISRVQVRMRDVNGDPTWVEVFPELGVKGNTVAGGTGLPFPDMVDPNFRRVTPNPHPIQIVTYTGNFVNITTSNMNNLPDNNGVIRIFSRQAMRDNPGGLSRRGGEPHDVKVDGVFNGLAKPGDIAKNILKYYGNIPDDDIRFFNTVEWNLNLRLLPEIGIVLDQKRSVYEWIERIQNGSLLGWQLLVDRNRYTARLDNPNRAETFNFSTDDIKNIHDVTVELDGENYASYTDIRYAHDWFDGESKSVIDQSQQNDILELYKFEKVFENDSLLTDKDNAALKGKVILEDFRQVRPIIRGIELDLEDGFDLKLFQIGTLDFHIELPERMKALQPYLNDRYFMGRLRCQIIGKKIDLQVEKVIIDVRQRDYTFLLPPEFFELIDWTGEYPATVFYQYDVDNKFASTTDNEFEYILDGGSV